MRKESTEKMVAVCRMHRCEFRAAVDQLSEKDWDWFLRVVFEPSDRHVLDHPEGDQAAT